jgi:uncharacterized membrane protein/protein-disulfide isomerase
VSSAQPIRLLKAIAFLSILGVVVASVSLYHQTAQRFGLQTEPSFCNVNAHVNCDAVNASPFAMALGIPVAAWGILFYLMFLFAALVGLGRDLISQRTLAGVLALFGLFSLVFSLYLFIVSEFVIGALCLVCITLDCINILLFLCAWKLWPGGDVGGRFLVGLRSLASFPLCLFDAAPRRSSLAWLTLFVAAVSAFGSLAAPDFMLPFIVLKFQAKTEKQTVQGVDDWKKQPKVEFSINSGGAVERDYQRGSPSAPVEIVEFSDYECPSCRSFAPQIDQVVSTYGDRVHFISKNFPLDRSCNPTITHEMHRYACLAAFFARCAGEQGKFWEAHNLLFGLEVLEKGRSIDEVRGALSRAGQALGLDGDALGECMSSERHKVKIQSDIQEGVKAELDHTPSIWINGRAVEKPTEATLASIIDSILAKNPSH